MTHRLVARGAAAGAITLAVVAPLGMGLGGTPADAAGHISQATARAAQLAVAGQGQGTGTFAAYDDGKGQQTSGSTQPSVGALEGQGLANLGVAAQEATATIVDEAGHSAACAGIAGEGGSIAQIGTSSCLTPGKAVDLTVGNLDLSKVVTIDPQSALAPLSQLNGPIAQVLGTITAPLTQALEGTPLGTAALTGELGAVQAVCHATPGQATGDATLADAKLDASFDGQTVNLATLSVHPGPNTHVVTGLDKVADAILAGVRTDLTDSLNGALGAGTTLTDALKEQVVDTVVAQVASQLQPLQDNVLDITLNKQTRPESGAIDVTAMDVQVLPAASQFTGGSLVSAQLGTVTCGPNQRVTTSTDRTTTTTKVSRPRAAVAVPTVVDSGLAGTPHENDHARWYLVGGALATTAAGAGGLVAYRRRLAALRS